MTHVLWMFSMMSALTFGLITRESSMSSVCKRPYHFALVICRISEQWTLFTVVGRWGLVTKSWLVHFPETAKFFDAVHFVDSNNPKAIKNAVCVFELDSSIPLRRHFQTDGKGYKFYGGLVSHTLVLRTITTAVSVKRRLQTADQG